MQSDSAQPTRLRVNISTLGVKINPAERAVYTFSIDSCADGWSSYLGQMTFSGTWSEVCAALRIWAREYAPMDAQWLACTLFTRKPIESSEKRFWRRGAQDNARKCDDDCGDAQSDERDGAGGEK